MASKEKQTIVAARVHSKRESPWNIQNVKVLGNSRQKPEADMRRQLSIVSQDAVEKGLVTIVAIIVSIAVLIAVVLVGKHFTQTYDHNKLKSVFQVFQVFVYLPKKAFKIPPNNG